MAEPFTHLYSLEVDGQPVEGVTMRILSQNAKHPDPTTIKMKTAWVFLRTERGQADGQGAGQEELHSQTTSNQTNQTEENH